MKNSKNLYQLPNGDWINPILVDRIIVLIEDSYGNQPMVSVQSGKSISLIHCASREEAEILRDKVASDLVREASEHDEEKCGNCRFWKQWESKATIGTCRRLPLTIDVLSCMVDAQNSESMDEGARDGILYWSQPTAGDDEWCGEWKPVRKP
jgi:hypothetical protein